MALYSLSSLKEVRVNGNDFMQNHPLTAREFTSWPELQVLHWGDSQVSNTVPSELYTLTDLSVLHLEHANLQGPLPAVQLGSLQSLRELSLRGNQLTGELSLELQTLPLLGELVGCLLC